MGDYAKLSSKGQVVIPADIRARLGWSKDTKLKVETDARGRVLFSRAPNTDYEIPDHIVGILKGLITSEEFMEFTRDDETIDY
jgi:AbrB family looped-hinge helix DNA binding protein